MTRDEAADAAVTCSMFAVFLGRVHQQEEAEAHLLRDRILKAAVPLMDHRIYGRDEKLVGAVLQDDGLRRLDALRVAAEVKAKRVAYLASHFQKLAESYKSLANARDRRSVYGD